MELDEYLRILLRRWPIWLVTIFVLGGLGYAYGKTRPVTYNGVASISFIKNVVPAAKRSADFQYDNFYSLESSKSLAQIASGWLSDAAFVAEIYARAGVSLPEDVSVTRYSRLITSIVLPGATVQVISEASTAEQAKALAGAAQTLVSERLNGLISAGTLDSVQVITSKPISSGENTNTTLALAVGIAIGVVIGFVLTFAWEGIRRAR